MASQLRQLLLLQTNVDVTGDNTDDDLSNTTPAEKQKRRTKTAVPCAAAMVCLGWGEFMIAVVPGGDQSM